MLEPLDQIDLELLRYPTLEQILPTLSKKTSKDLENIPDAVIRNVSIDIDKINIEKFKKKMDVIMDQLAVHEEPKNGTNQTRRQAVLPGTYGEGPFVDASKHMIKRKTIDCMLQTLYMGRHKVKELEDNKVFNSKDTGFRIAFTYRRLTRLFNKLMQIFTYGNYKRWSWDYVDPQMVLHAKAARVSVDFQYLWWVLIKVDNLFKAKVAEEKKKQKKKNKDKDGPDLADEMNYS